MADDLVSARASGSGRPAPLNPGARPVVRRVEAVVNPLSGSVGLGAAERLERLLAEYGFAARVSEAEPRDLTTAVATAVDAAPDLVVVLAGDGTAAMAARRAGADGPLIAPLPGGTMNMLPHALYGGVDWPTALAAALSGEVRPVSAGRVNEHLFYVAAILGAPALWARAREAVRTGKFWLAFMRARHACGRAFSGALHFDIGAPEVEEGEALTLLCPLISRELHQEGVLEAAALDPHGAGDAFRLGFNALTGHWRDDPSVKVSLITRGRAWARGPIPAVIDGEPIRLGRTAELAYVPAAFRALAPPPIQS